MQNKLNFILTIVIFLKKIFPIFDFYASRRISYRTVQFLLRLTLQEGQESKRGLLPQKPKTINKISRTFGSSHPSSKGFKYLIF